LDQGCGVRAGFLNQGDAGIADLQCDPKASLATPDQGLSGIKELSLQII
jgi:hypothetical protein